MRASNFVVLFLFVLSGSASAESDKQRVLAMLKKDPIVRAAVVEGTAFSGAKQCEYTVESSEPKQFEKGTTFDFAADIVCTGKREVSANIHVTGRMLSQGPQALTLSIAFAD